MRALGEWGKILIVSGLVVGYITFLATRSEAQNTTSSEYRQTRALEKIASELEKLRQCECR